MKILKCMLIVIAISTTLINCKKTEDESVFGYTDMKDTILKVESSGYGDVSNSLSIDLDKDKKVDLILEANFYFYHFSNGEYIQISSKNRFEICGTEVKLPKEYKLGDTVRFDNNYTEGPLIIFEETGGGSQGGGSTDFYGLPFNKVLYLAFRKLNGNKKELGWIKVKEINYSSIVLSGYNIVEDSEILIIK